MRMLIKLNYMYLKITNSMRVGWEYVALVHTRVYNRKVLFLVHSIIHTEILNILWMTTGTGGVDKYCKSSNYSANNH